jgi:hypothetical protein
MVVRCRPGIVTNAELGTIPDQQCSTALCFLLHSIRDTAILDSSKPSLYITALARASSETFRSGERLEHDPEKACPGRDPGWKPVFG